MTNKYQDRCPGCDKLFIHMSSFPALSRYGQEDLYSDCGQREAFEGDFIGLAIANALSDRNVSDEQAKS